jgi:hypothetical protein
MKKKKTPDKEGNKEEKANLPGYPLYPASEDIYKKEKKEKELDPDDISGPKKHNENTKSGQNNELSFEEDETGEDLDVPGSESDEKEENSGSEDEENNYYSLGGDDHNDLEENKGD